MKTTWPGFGGTTESGPQLVEVDLPLNKDFRENGT
jgi:hypothetical protein